MKQCDPDEMNEQRAAWAAQSLCLFQQMTGCDSGKECLQDLLTNLRHWADQSDIRWDATLSSAMNAYCAEVDDASSSRMNWFERNGYTCQMCGVAAWDADPLWVPRPVRLTMGHIKDKSKGGDDTPQNLRAVCTTCNEGLQNTALPKPDRIHLLGQIRKATIDDQEAVLTWLLGKFGMVAIKRT